MVTKLVSKHDKLKAVSSSIEEYKYFLHCLDLVFKINKGIKNKTGLGIHI